MNHSRRFAEAFGVWAVDVVCIIISYWIATQIRFLGNNDWGNKTLHYAVMVVLILVCTIYGSFTEWNRDFLKRGYFRELTAIVQYHVILLAVSMTIVFFMGWTRILSRQVILNFIWINIFLTYAAHLGYRRWLRGYLTNEKQVTKLLVVSMKDSIDTTIQYLHGNLDLSYQIVGTATIADLRDQDEEEKEALMREITEKLTQIPFDEVLIHTPGLTQRDIRPLIDGFEAMGVVARYSLELPDLGSGAAHVESFAGFTTLTYSRTHVSSGQLIVKRLIDILGGLAGCLITCILTIFIAPAIKLDSPGPVFFSQVRIGKNGRRFRIYKFRSMYQDAEARRKELEKENEVKGLMFKMEHDPRITKVGAFLRRTSLDEFPQFFNVLKGDMSLVGTRPPTEDEFEQYNEHYRRRLSMTPGLTGMWQVSGRSDIQDFDEVVKLDLYYIDNWSLALDFKIIFQTVGVMFKGKGAK